MQNGGVFEAATKRKVINQMIEHYAEKECDADQIRAIYYITKDERVDEICKKVVSQIQSIVDNKVNNLRRSADDEYQEKTNIRQDYYRAIL